MAVVIADLKSLLLRHRDHPRRRVRPGPEAGTPAPRTETLDRVQGPRQQVARWVAEDQHALGMAAGCGQQALVVGVAADDSVKDDDVGWFDGVRFGCDVEEPAVDAVGQPELGQQLRRLVLVVVGDLQVRHVGGTATQQLDLDLAHTTPDLQNRGALDAVLGQVLDHGRCRRVEAAPAIAAGHPIREPVTEDRPVTVRVAAVGHVLSIDPWSRGGPVTSRDMPSLPLLSLLLVVADFIVKVVALGFIPENRRPSSATAWLLAVFLIPFVGILAFLLIGSPYVDRGRRRIQAEVNEHVRHRLADDADRPGTG